MSPISESSDALDNYALIQQRNWFRDDHQRAVYGLSTEPDVRACMKVARFLSSGSTLIASLVVFPAAAFHLVHAAAGEPLRYYSLQIAASKSLLILVISLFWVFLNLRYLPEQRPYEAPRDPGDRPKYKRNGFAFFWLTFLIIGVLAWIWERSTFALLPDLSLIFIVFCILAAMAAYSKACMAPGRSHCSAPSNLITDVFHGLELHPEVGELHMKQALIRLGAVLNLVILWSCFFAQLSPSHVGFAIIGIQFLHCARRFWNEECYAYSMEISHYKVGLRELYRHLVLKPFLLNLGTISNVHRPASCDPTLLILLCLTSAACIVLAHLVDYQKFVVKRSRGWCIIRGRVARTISGYYQDAEGFRQYSDLLYSGFWGQARHLNYTLEFSTYCILAVPGLLNHNWFTAVPPGVLLVSLLNRSREDFRKCRRKYGPYWDLYCKLVPRTYLPRVL